MKKLLAFLAVVIIIAIIIFMFFGGLGFGKGFISGNTEVNSKENLDTEDESEPLEGPIIGTDNSADGVLDEANILISVVKNEYFYENKSILLDDFIRIIEAIDGIFVVEITDDWASLRTYSKLLDELEIRNISYIEKTSN